jgi:hypothetical protein
MLAVTLIFAIQANPLDVQRLSADPGITAVAVSRDGGYAFGFEDGHVEVWDSGGTQKSAFIERGPVWTLAFSPDGKRIATGFRDDGRNVTTGIWSVQGRPLRYLDALQRKPADPTSPMRGFSFVSTRWLAWSPDGRSLAAEHDGHLNTGVCIWSSDGTLLSRLSSISAGVHGLCFSPDGRSLAAGTDDGLMRAWYPNGSIKWEKRLSSRDSVVSVDYSPDGRKLGYCTSWQEELIGTLAASDGRPILRCAGEGAPSQVRLLPNNRMLVVRRSSLEIRSAGRTVSKATLPAVITSLCVSFDRRSALVATSGCGAFRVAL